MFKKIIKLTSIFAFFILVTSSTLLSNTSTVEAANMSSDINENNSMGIVIEEINDATADSKITASPDLGDDQAFPFIPGFGKNSGKDWSSFCLKGLTENKLLIFSKNRKNPQILVIIS